MTHFAVGSATDRGRVREGQEDFFLTDGELALFMVADGMGGHRGGATAAQLAVETMQQLAREKRADGPLTSEWFAHAVQEANDVVVSQATADPSLKGMGTTLCALALVQGEGYEALGVVNVGDSRLYILKDDDLDQITEDHSLVATLERQGRLTRAEAAVHPQRNIVTRALGIDAKVMVDSWEIAPVVGDRFLICSDGLFGEIDDNRIAATLRRLANPDDAARELVRLANEAGGRDNITCVVIDVVDDAGKAAKADGDRILSTVHGADRVLAELRESGEIPVVEVEVDTDEETAKVRRRSRFTWRVALFVVIFLAIIAAAVGTIIYTGTSTYYVGFDGDTVAIFQGRPGGVLWIDPELEETTTISRDNVPDGVLGELERGKEQSSLEDARRYVANLDDQIASRQPRPPSPSSPTQTAPSTSSTATGSQPTLPDNPQG
jgi:protein phosphatase